MPRKSEQSGCTSFNQTNEPRGTRWALAILAHVSPNVTVYVLLVRHSAAATSLLSDVALARTRRERTETR